MRRNLMPAILALVLVPATVVTVLRLMPEPPPSVLAFPNPTHRVAVAVDAAMRSELTSVSALANSSFSQDLRFMTAGGTFPTVGQAEIKEGDPAFWVGLGGSVPRLMRLQQAEITATTRDGRSVKATIKPDPFVEGSVVDFHGDAEIARVLSGKIAERLAHPAHKHESPEDRAALQAFFGPTKATVAGITPAVLVPPPPAAPDPEVRIRPARPSLTPCPNQSSLPRRPAIRPGLAESCPMSRRCLLAVLVAVGCLPGCGLGLRKIAGEPRIGDWTESTSHKEPPHRVALATLEAMRAELASADFAKGQDSEFAVARDLMRPGKKIPRPGESVPPDYPAFWVDWTAKGDGHQERNLVVLIQAHFEGKTRDGRPVQISVRRDVETVVTVKVGKHGDPKLGRFLGERISERLAHPLHPPGSAEEAEAFRAFFGGVESREAIPSLRKPAPKASSESGPVRK